MASNATKAASNVEAKSPLIPTPEKNWNESQWFWWTDKEKGFAGLHRIAHQPNAGTAHIWNVLIADDGRYTRRTSHTIAYADWMREDGVYSVEGLSFQHIESGGWVCKVSQDDFEAELTFADLYPAAPLDAYVGESVEEDFMADLAHSHFEAAGTVKGTVSVANRTVEISGFGHRDHSWGPRDTHDIQSSSWINGTTGPDFSFFATSVALFSGICFKSGYVVEKGKLTPLEDWDFRPLMEVDGVSYAEAFGELETIDNRRFRLQSNNLLGGAVVSHSEWIGFEGIMEFSANEHRGVACLERGVNCCGGLRFPGAILNGANNEGTGLMVRAR